MSEGEKRAYQRGYNAGLRNRWSEHIPPRPPDAVLDKIISAARSLRDEVDGFVAVSDQDDYYASRLGKRVDDFDHAMISMSKWIRKEVPG
ncbi:MAG: hypothetical protein EB060_10870 [Proteobacteria bacterium]|nr:hypothetical protein [Pseudomonadota bacterium]